MTSDRSCAPVNQAANEAIGQGRERRTVKAFTRWPIGRVLGVAAIVASFARILAVDIAGIVTTDSIGYLTRANRPFSHGFIVLGYRQAAYPVFIAFSNRVGDVLGWDHIFGVALLQRLMLMLAIGGLIWAARWWSAPTVLIATSATFVLIADFILTEGVVISCFIASGALLTATTYARVQARAGLAVLIGSALLAVFAGSVKMQFASLLAVTAATAWVLVRDELCSRRAALVVLTSATLLIVGLAGAQSIENRQNLGTFEPIAERHRSMYWGAWQGVFGINAENRENPELAEFYDDGPYAFVWAVERDVDDYGTRREMTIDRTEEMFEAAGTSFWEQRVRSFVGAFRGGRSDDLAGVTQRWLENPPGDALDRLRSNNLASTEGTDGVISRLNDGYPPGIITTGPVLDPVQIAVDDYRDWTRWLGPAALLLLVAAAMFGNRERPAAIGVLTMYVFCAAAMASGFTDNARYLIGPLTVVLIAGTNAVREFVFDVRTGRWRNRRSYDTSVVDTVATHEPPCEPG